MRNRKFRLRCSAFGLWLSALVLNGSVLAQSEHAVRTLVLETNVPEALVYIDSVLVGRADRHTFEIASSVRTIHLAPPAVGSWSIPPIEAMVPAPVDGVEGDTVEIGLQFPYYYAINSQPFGAEVRLLGVREQLVGTTPVTVQLVEPAVEGFRISLPGYREVEWSPGVRLWTRYVAHLDPLDEDVVQHVVEDMDRRRWWIDAVTLGVIGVSAATGIHYKFKADRRYEVYEVSGDPALRPEIKRLDTRAGVALGVMQAALGVLVVRLIID